MTSRALERERDFSMLLARKTHSHNVKTMISVPVERTMVSFARPSRTITPPQRRLRPVEW
jgi:hypothetical protein